MPKNLLFVVLSLNVGGLERMVIELIQGLHRKRHKIVICCLEEPGSLAHHLVDLGIEVIHLSKPPGIKLAVAWKIAALARARAIHLIHTHNSGPHFYGALAARLTARPVVHTKHGRNQPHDRSRVLLNRLAAAMSNTVVTVSADALELSAQLEKVPRKKLRVIPNGLDLSPYIATDRQQRLAPLRRGEINIGHVGRLSVEKNQAMLLRVFQRFVVDYPRASLHLVGDGPERAALERLAAQLALTARVRFWGYRSDVMAALAEFDWFALSSLTEGMPLAVIEAMATGMPIVATDVGGLREMIHDGQSGLLVPAADEARMLQCWQELARAPERTLAMGASARRQAQEEYGLERMLARYEALYSELIQH